MSRNKLIAFASILIVVSVLALFVEDKQYSELTRWLLGFISGGFLTLGIVILSKQISKKRQ